MGNKIVYISLSSSDYQQWEDFPQSPRLTADYPYQCIFHTANYNDYYLCVSTYPIVIGPYGDSGGAQIRPLTPSTQLRYGTRSVGGAWTDFSGMEIFLTTTATAGYTASRDRLVGLLMESNHDILEDVEGGSVLFSKTVNMSTDNEPIRIRNLKYKNDGFIRSRTVKWKDETFKRVNL